MPSCRAEASSCASEPSSSGICRQLKHLSEFAQEWWHRTTGCQIQSTSTDGFCVFVSRVFLFRFNYWLLRTTQIQDVETKMIKMTINRHELRLVTVCIVNDRLEAEFIRNTLHVQGAEAKLDDNHHAGRGRNSCPWGYCQNCWFWMTWESKKEKCANRHAYPVIGSQARLFLFLCWFEERFCCVQIKKRRI